MATTNEGIQPGQSGTTENLSPAPKVDEIPGGSTQQVAPVGQDADAVAAAEAVRRKQQSENDRETAKIANAIRTLRSQGINASADQVMQMLSSDPSKLQGNVSPQPVQQAAQPNVSGTGQEQSGDPVVRKAFSIMESEGGKHLDANDPEFKMIDAETDDPEVFLESVHKAAQAYAKRTGNISNPARIQTLSGGTGTHVPSLAGKSSTEILEQAYEELDQ